MTFYYTCEAGGRVGAHKRIFEGEMGIDGLEILEELERLYVIGRDWKRGRMAGER